MFQISVSGDDMGGFVKDSGIGISGINHKKSAAGYYYC